MKRLYPALTIALLSAVLAIGQQNPLTLDECVEMAVSTHPSVQAAQMGFQSAEYQRRMAIASALPSFKLEYSHTWLDEQPVIEFPGPVPITIPAGDDEIDSLTISATQPLFTGGATWNAWKLAKLNKQDADLQVEAAKMEITFQVKSAFYGVLKAKEFVQVAGLAVEMATSIKKRAQDFYDVGMIAKNNLLEAEVGVAEAQQIYITAQSGLSIAKSVLGMLIGVENSDDLEVEGKLEKVPFPLTMDECVKRGLEQRPEAQSARIRVEMAECLRKIERAGWFPFIAAVAAYTQEEGTFGSDPEVYSLTLAATWTFWEWGKKYYKVKSAAEMVKQAQQAAKMTDDRVTLEIKQAYYRLRQAEATIEVSRLGLASADENFNVVSAKFEQNMATSFDIITAQTMLTRAKTAEVSALADYMTAKAALERAMGMPLSAPEPSDDEPEGATETQPEIQPETQPETPPETPDGNNTVEPETEEPGAEEDNE